MSAREKRTKSCTWSRSCASSCSSSKHWVHLWLLWLLLNKTAGAAAAKTGYLFQQDQVVGKRTRYTGVVNGKQTNNKLNKQ